MSRLKLLPYGDLAQVVQRAGFTWKRRRGSHNTFQSPDGRTIVIPDHGSQVVVWPLPRKIARDIGLTVEEYNRLVDSM